VVFEGCTVPADYPADDDQADEGAGGAGEEEGFAANAVDEKEGGEGGEGVYDAYLGD
jgi:hypothetical protein